MKNFIKSKGLKKAMLGLLVASSIAVSAPPQNAYAQSDGFINIGLTPAQEKKIYANLKPAERKKLDQAKKKNAKCVRTIMLSLGIAALVGTNPKAAAGSLVMAINGCI